MGLGPTAGVEVGVGVAVGAITVGVATVVGFAAIPEVWQAAPAVMNAITTTSFRKVKSEPRECIRQSFYYAILKKSRLKLSPRGAVAVSVYSSY